MRPDDLYDATAIGAASGRTQERTASAEDCGTRRASAACCLATRCLATCRGSYACASRAAPPLDLKALEAQLRETKAIGFFTKISLKGKVADLLQQVREYHEGKSRAAVSELRQSCDLLLMKVLSLLQDDDPPLASGIVCSREAIWGLLL